MFLSCSLRCFLGIFFIQNVVSLKQRFYTKHLMMPHKRGTYFGEIAGKDYDFALNFKFWNRHHTKADSVPDSSQKNVCTSSDDSPFF